jgi:uncharacterized RDD family membrane protein YckC
MTQQRINIMQDTPVVTDTQEQPKIIYATVAERFVALLIDYGIVFLPCQFITWLWIKLTNPELELWQGVAIVAIINGLFVLYETIFSCGDRMTLGKALVGIAVVKQDLSGSVSFVRAFLRAVGYYISFGLFGCGFLWAFFDDRHRALHDFLGGSVVVQIREKSGAETLVLRGLGVILLLLFAGTIYFHSFGGGALVDRWYIRHARMQLSQIARLEEAHKDLYGYYTNDLLRLALLSGDPVQFQRDTRKILEPKGFKIGVSENSYKISAVAKDKKHTRVVFES